MAAPVPRVGVGVLLIKGEDEILVGQRKGSHGSGFYALPGGHLEFGESWEQCAVREVLEETGIELLESSVSFAAVNNNVMTTENKHYITIFMKAKVPPETEAQNMEPHKCEGWIWVKYTEVPKPAFMPLQQLLDTGFTLK
uniref:Nudix hydrolase domain-containing protein n=1 Tax=Pyramimonas obovata TaxID=1411642 RepID=A0A6T7UFD1_9CHLO|mmetsp:Transcript_10781/g.22470  ORF Transcript_10781/g.22470 Transcript_10781/m.22470 type:complete len:140 (+) Transcript_10781:60-479(+)